MKLLLPLGLIIIMIPTLISGAHWESNYQFDAFLMSHILALTVIIMVVAHFYLIKLPRLVVASAVVVLVGATSNFTVMTANGGFMPAPISIPYREYIPIEGTNLTWLADWIHWAYGAASPGDVFLVLGAVLLLLSLPVYLWKRLRRYNG